MVEEFRRRRDVLVAGLNRLPGVSCVRPDGAFYAFPNVSRITGDDAHLAKWLLEEAHVGCLGGSCFGPGGKGYLRFSYATALPQIELALERMEKALPRYRQDRP
jgi:aspartate/methionine/tyrosine aminotransferase